MPKFAYYYKNASNERHSGEMEAPDRNTVFVRLREQGIRAIKVEPQDGMSDAWRISVNKRLVVVCAIVGVAVTGVIAFFWGVHSATSADTITVATTQGPITFEIASPLERQRILGNRIRIEDFPTNLFRYSTEVLLARFAEPGRPLPKKMPFMFEEDLTSCLKNPIRVASTDLTEYIDLKRIVTGMKREAGAYLAEGGTVEGYMAELVKRQKMEIAYREKAETHLSEMLAPRPSGGKSADQSAAYAYWLKANAQLNSMGIYPLPLPDALRAYQMSVDIEE